MRLAIVSDVHGNLSALEAVIADLTHTAPDLVVHAGDLATHGHRAAEVVDRIRDLGWPGVHGNTDELIWAPERREEVQAQAPVLRNLIGYLFTVLGPATRERLGPERIAWLHSLPAIWRDHGVAVLHASPATLWKAPMPDADDETLRREYGGLDASIVTYGHIHRPFVRSLPGLTVANTGSVGLSYDGDRRASYLLIEDGVARTRRVEYDVEGEARALLGSGYPGAEWLAGILRTATPQPLPDPIA